MVPHLFILCVCCAHHLPFLGSRRPTDDRTHYRGPSSAVTHHLPTNASWSSSVSNLLDWQATTTFPYVHKIRESFFRPTVEKFTIHIINLISFSISSFFILKFSFFVCKPHLSNIWSCISHSLFISVFLTETSHCTALRDEHQDTLRTISEREDNTTRSNTSLFWCRWLHAVHVHSM